MFETKPIASLSAGLLARKGEAYPAIRRTCLPPVSLAPDGAPAAQPVRQQQQRIARSYAAPHETMPDIQVIQPRKTRTAFTLRLDTDRHLRLRLASAVSNRSAQQLVTEALDAFLDSRPGLDALAAQARKISEQN